MAEMMESLGFARKYRPSTLEGYIGNTQVKETVKRYLKNGRPQSILLTGNTGCGKTTIARLIIKEYLCENWSEETGACNECYMCEYINEYIKTGNGEFLPDVQEIDVADKSGKKDIASVIEGANYPSMSGWKVYMFDEAHSLTLSASTMLLKLIEEPPENVLFIFCTTDPQKMLETLKNRCQLKLKITKPTTSELVGYLKRICLNEGKDYDLAGLRMISARADYIIRDSLNYLEHVLNTRGSATSDSVSLEFQEVNDSIIFDFYKAYMEKDYLKYMGIMYKIKTNFDFSQFLASLSAFTIRGVYILNGIDVEGLSEEEIKSYMKVFKQFSIEELSYILSSLKKMSTGDIEVNFMTFIYDEFRVSENPTRNGVFSNSVQEDSVGAEKKFRNDNLKILEKSKLDKGIASLSDSMENVSVEDVGSMFNLEKVE